MARLTIDFLDERDAEDARRICGEGATRKGAAIVFLIDDHLDPDYEANEIRWRIERAGIEITDHYLSK